MPGNNEVNSAPITTVQSTQPSAAPDTAGPKDGNVLNKQGISPADAKDIYNTIKQYGAPEPQYSSSNYSRVTKENEIDLSKFSSPAVIKHLQEKPGDIVYFKNIEERYTRESLASNASNRRRGNGSSTPLQLEEVTKVVGQGLDNKGIAAYVQENKLRELYNDGVIDGYFVSSYFAPEKEVEASWLRSGKVRNFLESLPNEATKREFLALFEKKDTYYQDGRIEHIGERSANLGKGYNAETAQDRRYEELEKAGLLEVFRPLRDAGAATIDITKLESFDYHSYKRAVENRGQLTQVPEAQMDAFLARLGADHASEQLKRFNDLGLTTYEGGTLMDRARLGVVVAADMLSSRGNYVEMETLMEHVQSGGPTTNYGFTPEEITKIFAAVKTQKIVVPEEDKAPASKKDQPAAAEEDKKVQSKTEHEERLAHAGITQEQFEEARKVASSARYILDMYATTPIDKEHAKAALKDLQTRLSESDPKVKAFLQDQLVRKNADGTAYAYPMKEETRAALGELLSNESESALDRITSKADTTPTLADMKQKIRRMSNMYKNSNFTNVSSLSPVAEALVKQIATLSESDRQALYAKLNENKIAHIGFRKLLMSQAPTALSNDPKTKIAAAAA